MRNSEILERSFSVTILSSLPSGDSLSWVVRGFKGMYCEFSWLALKPVVETRILDSGESSSKFWVDQPGSRAALIFFAESEQS